MIRHMNPVVQIIVDTLVRSMEPMFVTKTVSQLMFEGYEDELLNITAKLNISDFQVPMDKFGWFYPVCKNYCVKNCGSSGLCMTLCQVVHVHPNMELLGSCGKYVPNSMVS